MGFNMNTIIRDPMLQLELLNDSIAHYKMQRTMVKLPVSIKLTHLTWTADACKSYEVSMADINRINAIEEIVGE